MTSLCLLLWIASGIVLQFVICLGIAFWRKWMDYLALSAHGEALDVLEGQNKLSGADDNASAAWLGFRTFRVDRKVFEDAIQGLFSNSCRGYLGNCGGLNKI